MNDAASPPFISKQHDGIILAWEMEIVRVLLQALYFLGREQIDLKIYFPQQFRY